MVFRWLPMPGASGKFHSIQQVIRIIHPGYFTRAGCGSRPLRKTDIISLVSDDTGLSKVKAEEVVNTIFDTIKEFLTRGESVILRRFGSFSVREKNARVGRNPRTGREAPISARRVVRFKEGRHFRDAVNGAGVKFP